MRAPELTLPPGMAGRDSSSQRMVADSGPASRAVGPGTRELDGKGVAAGPAVARRPGPRARFAEGQLESAKGGSASSGGAAPIRNATARLTLKSRHQQPEEVRPDSNRRGSRKRELPECDRRARHSTRWFGCLGRRTAAA